MNKVYVVRYGIGDLIQNFCFDQEIEINSNVIIQNEKGHYYGKVIKNSIYNDKIDYHKIIRVATQEDDNQHAKNLLDAQSAVIFAKKEVDKLGLKMVLLDAEYSFDRNQLLLNFTSDGRVDFRQLAKNLASQYRVRIELRQIGTRDRARCISGYGPCGQKLCCSRYLSGMDSVSINMAKNQNLALNPTKINGACNRLLCCLSYEDEVYTDNRSKLPEIGSLIEYNNKSYVVKSLNVLRNSCYIIVDKERVEVYFDENSKK